MTKVTDKILTDMLRRSDAGDDVETIAAAAGLGHRRVYQLLADHRPKRERKARKCSSVLRLKVLLYKAEGKTPAQIAARLSKKCSRAYVYKILAEGA